MRLRTMIFGWPVTFEIRKRIRRCLKCDMRSTRATQEYDRLCYECSGWQDWHKKVAA